MQYRFGIRTIQPEIFEAIQAEKKPLYISSHCSRPEVGTYCDQGLPLHLAEKATMVVDHIAYHKLDERYDSTIFAERIPGNVGRALETSRCIQDYVFWDSEGERCDVVHSYEDLLTVIQGTD